MNRFSNTPLLRLLLPFASGTIVYEALFQYNTIDFTFIVLFGLALVAGLYYLSKYSYYHIFGITTYLVLLLLGAYYKHQYLKQFRENIEFAQLNSWVGEIESAAVKSNGVKSYIINVKSLKKDSIWLKSDFKVNIQSRDSTNNLVSGDIVSGSSGFKKYEKALNPQQFNYAAFSANKGIFYYAYENNFIKHGSNSNLNSSFDRLRRKVIEGYKKMNIQEEELAVLIALTLGDKSQLSYELKQSYASAGAMHILAVSGLHVGIIFLLFNTLLKGLSNNKFQRVLRALVLLGVVWCFALITGFSSSVQRAACMFSFIIIAKAINRHSNVLNSIAASALLLILFNPNVIFEIGFQLSYAAVIGIVLIHPMLYVCYTPKYWLIEKIWSLSLVSISATIATLPFSLYYFHQFPNWFLITNLFVIPLAFVIVAGGALLIASWFIFKKDFFLADALEYVLFALNKITTTVSNLPLAKSDNIWITVYSVWILLLAIGSFIAYLYLRRKIHLIRCLLLVALVFAIEFSFKFLQLNKQFVGFYALKGTPICAVNGLKAEVFSKEEISWFNKELIQSHLHSIGVDEINWLTHEQNSSANYILTFNTDGYTLIQMLDLNAIELKTEEKFMDLPLDEKLIWMVPSPKLLEKLDSTQNILLTYDYPKWRLEEIDLQEKINFYSLRKEGYWQLNR